jgi:hypothetical protein
LEKVGHFFVVVLFLTMMIRSEPFLDFEEKILGTHFKYIFTKSFFDLAFLI